MAGKKIVLPSGKAGVKSTGRAAVTDVSGACPACCESVDGCCYLGCITVTCDTPGALEVIDCVPCDLNFCDVCTSAAQSLSSSSGASETFDSACLQAFDGATGSAEVSYSGPPQGTSASGSLATAVVGLPVVGGFSTMFVGSAQVKIGASGGVLINAVCDSSETAADIETATVLLGPISPGAITSISFTMLVEVEIISVVIEDCIATLTCDIDIDISCSAATATQNGSNSITKSCTLVVSELLSCERKYGASASAGMVGTGETIATAVDIGAYGETVPECRNECHYIGCDLVTSLTPGAIEVLDCNPCELDFCLVWDGTTENADVSWNGAFDILEGDDSSAYEKTWILPMSSFAGTKFNFDSSFFGRSRVLGTGAPGVLEPAWGRHKVDVVLNTPFGNIYLRYQGASEVNTAALPEGDAVEGVIRFGMLAYGLEPFDTPAACVEQYGGFVDGNEISQDPLSQETHLNTCFTAIDIDGTATGAIEVEILSVTRVPGTCTFDAVIKFTVSGTHSSDGVVIRTLSGVCTSTVIKADGFAAPTPSGGTCQDTQTHYKGAVYDTCNLYRMTATLTETQLVEESVDGRVDLTSSWTFDSDIPAIQPTGVAVCGSTVTPFYWYDEDAWYDIEEWHDDNTTTGGLMLSVAGVRSSSGGVGTILKGRFAQYKILSWLFSGCSKCSSLAKKMNQMGIDWCEKHKEELIEQIKDNAGPVGKLPGARTKIERHLSESIEEARRNQNG